MNLRLTIPTILVLSLMPWVVHAAVIPPALVSAASANTVNITTLVDHPCGEPVESEPNDPKVLCVRSSVSQNNALIVEISVTVSTPSKVFVVYENPETGRFKSKTSKVAASDHTISLLRLRPSTTYVFQAFVEGPQGAVVDGLGGSFTTGPLPAGLEVAAFNLLQGQSTSPLVLLEHSAQDFIGIVALDSEANVVWYYEAVEEDGIGPLIQQLDGNILYQASGFLGVTTTGIKEVTPLGEVVASNPVVCELPLDPGDPVPEGGVHHEILAPVNGKVLYLGRIIRDPFNDPARLQASDSIRQWDKTTGEDVRVWDPFDFLDPLTERTARSDTPGGTFWASCDGALANEDWTHSNSIQVGPSENIIMSVRHLNQIIAIAPDFQSLEWRLGGPSSDFTFPDPSDQFYHQHSARELPNGNILLFDNGNTRPEEEGGEYSRGLELALDTENMTASKVWEFRHDPDLFVDCCSNVTRLANGNSTLMFGCCTPGFLYVEVDPNGNVVAEIDIRAPGKFVQYRAYPIEQLDGESEVQTLEPALPNAVFTANVTSGLSPLSVEFTDQSTGNPTSWQWDFDTATDSDGDGIPENDVDSMEQNPAHVYVDPGTFGVKLTVTAYDLVRNERWQAGSSQTIVPTPLVAAQVVFSVQPDASENPLYLEPVVIIQDALGTTVATSYAPVTLNITTDTGVPGAALLGTATVNATKGIARFGGLSVSLGGSNYALTANSPGLNSATSSAFEVLVPVSIPATTVWSSLVLAGILLAMVLSHSRSRRYKGRSRPL